MSTDKRTDYPSDEVPFGPIAAAASTLIKEVVLRDAVPWSKEEAKRIKASPWTDRLYAFCRVSQDVTETYNHVLV